MRSLRIRRLRRGETVEFPMNSSNIWDEILARIQAKVNRHSFYTWFKPTTFIADEGGTLSIRVPNSLFKDWITKHYSGVIGEALVEVNRAGVAVNFTAAQLSEGDSPSLPAPGIAQNTIPPPTTSVAGLNPRYTFDTFIVGSSNQFAHAACRAVAEA